MSSSSVECTVNSKRIRLGSRTRKRGKRSKGQRERRAKEKIQQQLQKLTEATNQGFISLIKYTKPCTVSPCLTSSLDTDENKNSVIDRHIDLLEKSIGLSVVSIEKDCIHYSDKESTELSCIDLKKDTIIHLCEESFKLSNINQDDKPIDNGNMFIGGQSLSETDKKYIPVVYGQILSSEESTSQAEVPNTGQMTEILEDVKPFSSHETFCHYISTLLLSIPESSEKEELKVKIVGLILKFKTPD